MELFANLGWIILGLVLLYYGAEWLVQGASTLAIRCGLSPLVVGLTVVAFGTSAPELAVSVDANLDGNGGMALGNVVGSNICNIALVLGAAAIVFPIAINRQIIRREMPILLGISVLFVWFLRDGEMSQIEGGVLTGMVILYVGASLWQAKREKVVDSDDLPEEVLELAKKGGLKRIAMDVGLVVVGIALLVVGANRMVFGGEQLALAWGVSPEVIALTLFAFGTSLPELATSVVAAMKKQGDIVVGNVVGSCIFNLLAVVGMTASIAPLGQGALGNSDLFIMLGITFLVMPMMWHRRNVSRWEGALLLVAYLSYFGWLVVKEIAKSGGIS